MKKFFKYLFYIIIVSIFASVCRLLVLYLMTGELGQKPHIQTKQTLTYKDIDLGWAKTSLPFSLEENSQQAIKMKEAINNAFNAQIVNDIKLYQGTYNSKEFSLGIGRNVYIPSLSLTQNATENSFRDSITGAGLDAKTAEQAVQKAQKSEENGIIKYAYVSEAKIQNTPAVFGIVTCAKGNNLLILFGNGMNTPLNKDILTNAVNKTECFPQ